MYHISAGSVTYAIKGRDILRKKGFKAKIEKKTSGKGGSGCGYTIAVEGDGTAAERILREAGIKILEANKF